MSDDQAFAGFQQLASGTDEYNQLDFVVRSILNRIGTATLVQVKKVTAAGEVAPVGFIDVSPMVAMIDGAGKTTPHGIIHNVPYFRLQGGTNAVIIDPVVGDIGICVFASRDISSVKQNKAPANPGSRRTFSYADALYLGGVLNAAPERYIRFKSDGDVEIKPASKVFVLGDLEVQGDTKVTGNVDIDGTAHADGTVSTGANVTATGTVHATGGITTDGTTHATGNITSDGDVIADGKSLKTHIHSGVTVGTGNTGMPV